MALVDTYDRPVNDLRIAVTAACPLSCGFCHREGVTPRGDQMTADEIERIVRVGADLGIDTVKITGGEPLVRADLPDVVERIDGHVDEVSMVTNGQRLPSRAAELHEAGLDRVNVSLHTLRPDRYQEITGGEGPPLAGIEAAREAGLPAKANVVVSEANADEVEELLSWAVQTGTQLQLIEIHGPPEQWERLEPQYESLASLQQTLEDRADEVTRHRLHDRPRYHLDETTVEVTRPMWNASFCSACSRLRLTADGRLQTCLLRPVFVEILDPIRDGCDDETIRGRFREATRLREPTWSDGETPPDPGEVATPWLRS